MFETKMCNNLNCLYKSFASIQSVVNNWHPTKNGSLKPINIKLSLRNGFAVTPKFNKLKPLPDSYQILYFKCFRCNHGYSRMINYRGLFHCPYCMRFYDIVKCDESDCLHCHIE